MKIVIYKKVLMIKIQVIFSALPLVCGVPVKGI